MKTETKKLLHLTAVAILAVIVFSVLYMFRHADDCKTKESAEAILDRMYTQIHPEEFRPIQHIEKAYIPQKTSPKIKTGTSNTAKMIVFVCDISEAMDEKKLETAKSDIETLLEQINPDDYAGLISYDKNIYINAPIEKLNQNHKSVIAGCIDSLNTGCGASLYDSVIVADKLINDKQKDTPEIEPYIIMLSCGDYESGHTFENISSVIKVLNIPIYSINYNEHRNTELQQLSLLTNGHCINVKKDEKGKQHETETIQNQMLHKTRRP